MHGAVDTVAEIFAWLGFGVGTLVAGLALILYLVDGTWRPVRIVIDDAPEGRVARWFGDDGVGQAVLTAEQEQARKGEEGRKWTQEEQARQQILAEARREEEERVKKREEAARREEEEA